MADLRIADAPELALEDITGNEKIPTGGYGNSAVTINSLGQFAKTALSLATEAYVSNAVGQKENKILLTGVNLTPSSTYSDIPQTNNTVLNTIHQDLLNRMEWIKDNVAVVTDHQELSNRSTFNTHPSTSISHNGTSNVSIEIEELKNDVLTIETETIPELNNTIIGKQDVIVNDVNLTPTSVLSPVPSTNNSSLNSSLQALMNRDEFRSVHNNLSGREVANSHPATAISYDTGNVSLFLDNQKLKNKEFLSLNDYRNLVINDDWSDAIIQALSDGKSQSKSIYIPSGTYNYSKSFTIEIPVIGSGRETTRLRKIAPAEITILKGCLNNITVSPDSLISGDTTRGVIIDGLDRKDIYDLWIEKHGSHGLDYRRGNLSRFVVHSRSNNGRGVNMAADTNTGDNKACEIFVEANANGLSGFYIEQNASQVYTGSSHYGAIRSQNNGTRVVADDNYDVVLTGRGHDLNIYCEYGNKSVWLRTGLQSSKIFFSNMSYVTMLNEADDTNIISYIPSALGTRVTMNEKFEKWTIQKENSSYSGKLALSHTANNTFTFEATLSGAQQFLEIPSNLTIRGAGNSYNFAKTVLGGATLNFGTIPAQSSVERTINITNIPITSQQTSVIASPAGDIGANLIKAVEWISAFDATAKTATVTIRVTNPTTSPIVSNQLAWRVQVIL